MKKYFQAFILVATAVLPWPSPAQGNASQPAAVDAPLAQYCSAFMYRILPGDFNFCIARKLWLKGKWSASEDYLKLAAGWGSKAAQQALGVAYFNGDGLQQNRPQGLAWLQLGAERGDPAAKALYESAAKAASPAELVQAQEVLSSLQPRYADAVAAQRADKRYRRELDAITHDMSGGAVYGRGACLEGMASLALMRASLMGFENVENPTNTCTMSSERNALAVLDSRYQLYFSGWKGVVTTGSAEAAGDEGSR